MELPRFIDLGPYHYKIICDELTRLRTQEKILTAVLGHTDHDKLEIIINNNQPPSLSRETLFHESLHVVTEITGLRYSWGATKSERFIRRLSPMMLELMRRNPDVVAYLMSND